MTYTLTNSDTGRTFTFASEAAYEAALAWYNEPDRSKDIIVDFCKAQGLDLTERTDDPYYPSGTKLRSDWHDAAMECYAATKGLK